MAKRSPKYGSDKWRRLQAIHEPADEGEFEGVNQGAAYTADEIEFMLAMDRYKRRTGHQFPTWSEVLGVLVELGYRKEQPCTQP